MNDEFKEIAERIAGLRDACGYTQEEFAEKLGINIETYKGYEETGADVPISTIYQISKLCNVSKDGEKTTKTNSRDRNRGYA